jgi:hypothetical protein
MAEHEADGPGGDPEPFDHAQLETLGRAVIDAGRGLVRFGAEYPYADQAEREIRRQRFGRIVALINAVWPQVDAEIKADRRPAISDHQRDARMYHLDRLFRMMTVAAKVPPEDD